jgi:hypothetical protein
MWCDKFRGMKFAANCGRREAAMASEGNAIKSGVLPKSNRRYATPIGATSLHR